MSTQAIFHPVKLLRKSGAIKTIQDIRQLQS